MTSRPSMLLAALLGRPACVTPVRLSRSSPTSHGGDHLVGRFSGPAERAPALVLGHFDTVWPIGTLERMPFRLDETGRAHGPGVFDMKASLVVFLAVMEQLKKHE